MYIVLICGVFTVQMFDSRFLLPLRPQLHSSVL